MILYDKLIEWYENNKVEIAEDVSLEDIAPQPKKSDFSVSALPMTQSVDELVNGYKRISAGEHPSDNSEIAACVFHDLTNYNISTGLIESEFLKELKKSFFLLIRLFKRLMSLSHQRHILEE